MGRRSAGSYNGAAAGATAALAAALGMQVLNPWFLDAPWAYLALVSLPLAALGALVGARVGAAGARRGQILLFATLLGVPGVSSLWRRPPPSGDTRLFVFGADGATWDVIDPLGLELPTFQALASEGARAPLRSQDPMFSPLLWTTMASGKPPDEHGIHGFHVQATDCVAARFWDVMEAAGLSVGTYKWLVTYPPSKILAFQVPAWLAPGPETWPPDLAFIKEIELSHRLSRKQVQTSRGAVAQAWDGARHGLRFSTLVAAARFAAVERFSRPDPLRAYFDGQILRVWMDRDVFVATLHHLDPEVATFTDYATDAVPHRFWRYREPALFPGTDPALVARWGQAVNDAYRQADRVLAELRREVGPQARVVVLSDHGHHALPPDVAGHGIGPRTERLSARLNALVGPVDVCRLGHKLVVGLTGPDPVAEAAALQTWTTAFTVASTGLALFRTEPVPDQPRAVGLAMVDQAVSATPLDQDRVGGEPLSDYLVQVEAFSGDHAPLGVFLAAGPGLGAGRRLPEMSILDVAPTLLALVDLPAAEDMAGTVPSGLFVQPPTLPPRPASYDNLVAKRQLMQGTAGVNEEQLRALGYIQ